MDELDTILNLLAPSTPAQDLARQQELDTEESAFVAACQAAGVPADSAASVLQGDLTE